jgi:hypothetical protein
MAPPKKPRSPASWRTQSRAGATVTGAGGGAFLLSILQSHTQGHDELWIKLLIYLTPSLSFAVTACLNWLLLLVDAYLTKFDQNRKYREAKKVAEETLKDPTASPESKALAQQLIDEAHRYKLSNARLRLQSAG